RREFLNPGQSLNRSNRTTTTAQDAVTADPSHYIVLFENDMARLLRIKYPAGAKSVMHNHPAGCGIFLVDQKFKLTMANHPIPSASRCSARSIVLPHGVLRISQEMSDA